MKDPFCYSFRFCCDPGFNDKREIETLKTFVEEADIDDVSVFCNVEELNTGHMTVEEQRTYIQLLNAVQDAVAPMGVSVSVNHWHSLMHADLGKQLLPEQNFRLMVDMEGNSSQLCVCPMCEQWQTYFCDLYRRYAQAVKPNILWVEDDFRLHNHDPLIWGGCFCQAHMEEYQKRAGQPLSREAFIKGVLAPGDPHPYRKIWLDVHRETMRTLAERIGQAVHSVSPETKVGLMSSVPFVHAAEGRDWHGILKGFAGENPPVNRIHLPCYSEAAPKDYLANFNMVSMANRALIPKETEVLPELENYPYSLFAKSRNFTRFQILSAMPLDLAGITIDLFDLNGSGIVLSDGYQNMLRQVKPFLNTLTRQQVMKKPKQGVYVMLCETSSYTAHTTAGLKMEELYPQEVYFAGLLNAMGISYRYCLNPEIENEVCAVSGQYFRNLTDDQIRHFFLKNRVIVSGDAVEVLCQRGLGSEIGVSSCLWMKQNGGEYAYEQVCTDVPFGGIPNARASAVISSTDALNISYSIQPELLTVFCDSYRRKTAPGHAIVDNRVLVYPFGHFSAPADIPPMQLNTVRRDMMQFAVSRFDSTIPMVADAAYLQPYCTQDGNAQYLYLVNGGTDAQQIKIKLNRKPDSVSLLRSDDTEIQPEWRYQDGVLNTGETLMPMDACLLSIFC